MGRLGGSHVLNPDFPVPDLHKMNADPKTIYAFVSYPDKLPHVLAPPPSFPWFAKLPPSLPRGRELLYISWID